MSENQPVADSGDEGGAGDGDTSQNPGAPTPETEQSVPKAKYEELLKKFGEQGKSLRNANDQLRKLKNTPPPKDDEPDDEPDDDADDDSRNDAKDAAAIWKQRLKREREKAQREIDKIRAEANADKERANRQIANDLLTKAALEKGAHPKLVGQFIKLFRDEFEFEFDGDETQVAVKDGKHYDFNDYLAELLDENPHFKQSKRKAGTGDDGGADDGGSNGQKYTREKLDSMTPAQFNRLVQTDPEAAKAYLRKQ